MPEKWNVGHFVDEDRIDFCNPEERGLTWQPAPAGGARRKRWAR